MHSAKRHIFGLVAVITTALSAGVGAAAAPNPTATIIVINEQDTFVKVDLQRSTAYGDIKPDIKDLNRKQTVTHTLTSDYDDTVNAHIVYTTVTGETCGWQVKRRAEGDWIYYAAYGLTAYRELWLAPEVIPYPDNNYEVCEGSVSKSLNTGKNVKTASGDFSATLRIKQPVKIEEPVMPDVACPDPTASITS